MPSLTLANSLRATVPYSPFIGSSLALDFTSGNNTLSPQITFSRTTNATLTGSNGLIQNAPMNLLTFSEQFDNAVWIKSNATVTANTAIAPDGTLTADKIIPDTTNLSHYFTAPNTVAANTPVTVSVYAKAAGYDTLVVRASGSSLFEAVFNLATGTITSQTGGTASIVSVGNGWCRCAFTCTTTAFTNTPYFFIRQTTAFAGDGTSGIYMWGAQLELGSTATTYNPTTVKNLLGFTENFDNAAWTKYDATITSGFTDIYGQPFAQKLVENTANAQHITQQSKSAAASPYTFTCYLKAGERSWAILRGVSLAEQNVRAWFDLANGIVGTVNAGGIASITAVGNGWYRCSLTVVSASSLNYEWQILISTGDNVLAYTGDGTSGIYIFGAQLSDSASVDPYVYQPVAAPASTAYYGPRFDYDPVTLAPKGLLIEEQRTNLVTYSEQFDNAAWTKIGMTVTANVAVAPDGTTTADRVVYNGAGAASTSATQNAVANAPGSNQTITVSVWLKSFGGSNQLARLKNTHGGVLDNFSSNLTITNQWQRFTFTVTNGAGVGTSQLLGISPETGNSAFDVLAWGAQMEIGAFATSYIPTVASQVTRAADSASMIGNNFARWYNVNTGTMYAEGAGYSTTNGSLFVLRDSLTGYQNQMPLDRIGALNVPRFAANANGVSQFSLVGGTNFTAGVFFKLAGAYQVDNFAASFNGGEAVTDNLGTTPVNIVQAEIGRLGATQGEYLNGTIKRIAYYPRRLANSELQSITS